jgi:hypothetical protein
VPLIKSYTSLGNLVQAPYAGSSRGAVCLTCGKLCDEEAIVEGYPGESVTCKVLVRHHGGEELRTFNMGSTNWDEHDLAQLMSRTNWFDPRAHEGLGLGIKMERAGDHDDKDDGEFKVFSGAGTR